MLPAYLRPLSYVLPLWLNFAAIAGFCVILFYISLRNIHKRWLL